MIGLSSSTFFVLINGDNKKNAIKDTAAKRRKAKMYFQHFFSFSLNMNVFRPYSKYAKRNPVAKQNKMNHHGYSSINDVFKIQQ